MHNIFFKKCFLCLLWKIFLASLWIIDRLVHSSGGDCGYCAPSPGFCQVLSALPETAALFFAPFPAGQVLKAWLVYWYIAITQQSSKSSENILSGGLAVGFCWLQLWHREKRTKPLLSVHRTSCRYDLRMIFQDKHGDGLAVSQTLFICFHSRLDS